MILKLLDLTGHESEVFGSAKGRIVFEKLQGIIDSNPLETLIQISMEGVTVVDTVFVRDSVGAAAKLYLGSHYFVLVLPESRISSNITYGLRAQGITLPCVTPTGIAYAGDELSKQQIDTLMYIRDTGELGTTVLSKHFGVSLPNAGVRLKGLAEKGLLFRNQLMSPSGGKEFSYRTLV